MEEATLSQALPLITLDRLDIFEHLDREVAVLVDDQGKPWGNHIVVCLSPKSLAQQIQIHQRPAKTFPLARVIDFLLKEKREILQLYGFALGDYALEREELCKIAGPIETFCLLLTCIKEQLSPEETFERMKQATVYYLGSPILSPQTASFDFEVQEIDGKANITLFLSEQSARRYAFHQKQVVPVQLASFRSFVQEKYGLVLEPRRPYCLRF